MLKRLERIGDSIMNRAGGSTPMAPDPIGSVLSAIAPSAAPRPRCSGQAYVTAYSLMAQNREPLERIADTLVERKEMHGDEVVDLLATVGLKRPQIDLMDDRTWPTV